MARESKVIACIDGARSGESVARHAAWAAQRIQLGLELLHIIERHPALAGNQDHSGTLGLNAQENLLEQYASEEEARSRRDRDQARALLSQLREMALTFVPPSVDTRLRHGDLEETIQSHASEVGLLVLGRNGHIDVDPTAIGQHVASTVHTAKRPTLVVAREFKEPRSFVLAFDGSSALRQKILSWTLDPLLAGLPVHVVVSSDDMGRAQSVCTWATSALQGQGVEADGQVTRVPLAQAMAQLVDATAADWVVMGAYSDAWWKRWFQPSHTDRVLSSISATAYLIPA